MEDLYRPYRPKRRTRAMIARERGLEPLAQRMLAQAETAGSPEEIAAAYVNPETAVDVGGGGPGRRPGHRGRERVG